MNIIKMTAAAPAIDFMRIDFPTDSLTVKTLRRIYPHSFDLPASYQTGWPGAEPVYGRNTIESTLGAIIDSERLLAGVAFKQAAGVALTTEEAREPRWSIVDDLVDSYVTAGLAVGSHQAAQMIRDIEAQAVAQAKGHGSPAR